MVISIARAIHSSTHSSLLQMTTNSHLIKMMKSIETDKQTIGKIRRTTNKKWNKQNREHKTYWINTWSQETNINENIAVFDNKWSLFTLLM